jgi:hypothetical protein
MDAQGRSTSAPEGTASAQDSRRGPARVIREPNRQVPTYAFPTADRIANGDVSNAMLPAGKYEAGDPRNDPEYEQIYNERMALIDAHINAGRETSSMFKHGDVWDADRVEAHQAIIDDIFNGTRAGKDHQGVIMGGLPGSGKSTLLKDETFRQQMGITAHVDERGSPVIDSHIVVNPDEMKVLIQQGTYADGRPLLDRSLYPDLDDNEFSSITHEESSILSKMLADQAMAQGYNVVWDVTLGKPKNPVENNPEYDLRAGFVKGDVATSLHRAGLRHKAPSMPDPAQADAADGEYLRTHKGRIIPLVNIPLMRQADGKIANEEAFYTLLDQGIFSTAVIHNNGNGSRHTVTSSADRAAVDSGRAIEQAAQAADTAGSQTYNVNAPVG